MCGGNTMKGLLKKIIILIIISVLIGHKYSNSMSERAYKEQSVNVDVCEIKGEVGVFF